MSTDVQEPPFFFLFRVLAVPNASLPTQTLTNFRQNTASNLLSNTENRDRHVDFMKAIPLQT